MANFTTSGSDTYPASKTFAGQQYSTLMSNVGLSTSDRTGLTSHTFTITAGNKCFILGHGMIYRSGGHVDDYCHLKIAATNATTKIIGHVVGYRMPTSDTYWSYEGGLLTSAISGTSCICTMEIDVVNAAGPGFGLEYVDYYCLEIDV